MALTDVSAWMDEWSRSGVAWYAKRLAANDTKASGSNQAGPYMQKQFMCGVFPSMNKSDAPNPDVEFDMFIDSHPDKKTVRGVWYKKEKNEARITRFGGGSSAMLDPDSTGALVVMVFILDPGNDARECHAWICGGEGIEADLVEERIGPVEPKRPVIWIPGEASQASLFSVPSKASTCRLTPSEILPEWMTKFPSGEEIILRTVAKRPPNGFNVDRRLIRRRDCEYDMFKSIEEAVYMPRISRGFDDIEAFIGFANSILQSRKSRSGNSLELHIREIMKEEGLVSGVSFTHKPIVDGGKRPDFLFPSQVAYEDESFPRDRLRMLAAKTTCKDRWRQILNEANRIPNKHLLTLQEGVSENQFKEMMDAGVTLVVPSELHERYPRDVRPHLMSFESFIGDVRLLSVP